MRVLNWSECFLFVPISRRLQSCELSTVDFTDYWDFVVATVFRMVNLVVFWRPKATLLKFFSNWTRRFVLEKRSLFRISTSGVFQIDSASGLVSGDFVVGLLCLRRTRDCRGANQSQGSSIVRIRLNSPSSAWSASRSFVAKNRGSYHNVRAPRCGSWPWHASTSRCTNESAQIANASKLKTLVQKGSTTCGAAFNSYLRWDLPFLEPFEITLSQNLWNSSNVRRAKASSNIRCNNPELC
jgi:hypothetical protein